MSDMTILEQWRSIAYNQNADKNKLQRFWANYFNIEKNIYEQLLENPDEVVSGTVKELAEKYGQDVMTMVGFLDGINDSLKVPNPIETMDEDTKVNLAFDKEALYKNMVDAKADWLYNLPQWDKIFTEEKKENPLHGAEEIRHSCETAQGRKERSVPMRKRQEIQTLLRKIMSVKKNLDYIIVLGAHVDGTRMTLALLERARRALLYLEENPGTKAVLSGGKGDGENISEAEAMYRYLTGHGIDGDRLIREEESTSTKENLEFSRRKIGTTDCSVGVVTNNFHVWRGAAIARKCGFREVAMVPSRYRSWRLFIYIPREILAIIKDKLMGNL